MRETRGDRTHAAGYERRATRGRRHAGRRQPRLTLATLLGAARRARGREHRGRRRRAQRRLRPARGRQGEHARSTTASASGTSRSVVRERHEITPGARAASTLTLDDRRAARRGARAAARRLPRWPPRPAAPATPAPSAWASVLDVSQGGLALRTAVTYGAGDLIDVELDDGTGAVISARVEIVELVADEAGGIARGRIVAVADDGAQRLARSSTGCATRPSDAERPRPSRCRRCAERRSGPRPARRLPAGSRRAVDIPLATLSGVDLTYVTSGRVARPGHHRGRSPACRRGSRSTARRSAATSARRQAGYGRSPRQQIEKDDVEILGGVRHGLTLGGPARADRRATATTPTGAPR